MAGIQVTHVLLKLTLVLAGRVTNAQHLSSSRQTYDNTPSTATICEARTVNYITHSLPQACLTSIWSSQNTSGASSRAEDVSGLAMVSKHPPTLSASTTADATENDETENDVTATTSAEAEESTFMSFENWKEMMLKKTGQDPHEMRSRKSRDASADDRTPPEGGYGELGEEDEISLNFNNLGDSEDAHGRDGLYHQDNSEGVEDKTLIQEDGNPPVSRSKDAGKTCKERFSYSSFDAGATVLKTGPATQNAKAILVENKDSYMLLECAQNKFVIVELSDDIMVDTIVLANFEFFSSMIRHFRVSVSDRYPVKIDKWKDPRVFEARNSRDIQPFLVENPQIWAKYVRIEFLTHYGNEYYCPISLLRVHGTRMLDSWKDSETGRDEDGHEEIDEPHHSPEIEAGQSWSDDDSQDSDLEKQSDTMTSQENLQSDRLAGEPIAGDPQRLYTSFGEVTWSPIPGKDVYQRQPPTSTARFYLTWHTCATSPVTATTTLTASTSQVFTSANHGAKTKSFASHNTGDAESSGGDVTTNRDTTQTILSQPNPDVSSNQAPVPAVDFEARPKVNEPPSRNVSNPSDASSAGPEKSTSKQDASSKATSSKPSHGKLPPSKGLSAKNSASGTPTSKSRGNGTVNASASSPTAQQGFFNSVTKRLQQVEANLTLSLNYIEDQSRHIQDTLQRAEQKQASKVSMFLDALNQTVLSELREIREQYDQIWQSTVIALDSQKDHSERDIVALSTRLNLLADEVVFQKRMAIVQAILLLSCLFLVIFSRGVPIPYLAPLLEPSPAPVRSVPNFTIMGSAPMFVNESDFPDATSSPDYSPSAPVRAHQDILRSDLSASDSIFNNKVSGSSDHRRERLSPPLTPRREVDEEDTTLLSSGYEEQGSVVRRLKHTQSRKPLPALPEHPSSPDG